MPPARRRLSSRAAAMFSALLMPLPRFISRYFDTLFAAFSCRLRHLIISLRFHSRSITIEPLNMRLLT